MQTIKCHMSIISRTDSFSYLQYYISQDKTKQEPKEKKVILFYFDLSNKFLFKCFLKKVSKASFISHLGIYCISKLHFFYIWHDNNFVVNNCISIYIKTNVFCLYIILILATTKVYDVLHSNNIILK